MGHGILIAKSLARVLNRVGHKCQMEAGILVIPEWELQLQVVEEGAREEPGSVSFFPSIVAYHPVLPMGFARELAVGMGTTAQQAIDSITASWMLLVFPILKFLFEDHPHDCTVHEQAVQLTGADQPYRLIAGPVQVTTVGNPKHSNDVSQSLLWEAVSDLLLTKVRHGVHHIRCYAGRFGDQIQADVFMDGEEWPEGSARLRQLAETFPAPSDADPVYALKQHLFLRPEHLMADLEREENEQVLVWLAAIQDRIDAARSSLAPQVLQALWVTARCLGEPERKQLLIKRGIPRDVAGHLVVFLPSVAARVLLNGQAEFSETYYWTNHSTHRAVERRYDQTPLFMAATEALARLHELGLAKHELSRVADGSAEMNSIRKAAAEVGEVKNIRFTIMIHHTDEPVDGEDLGRLLARHQPALRAADRPAKPWWRFW